MNSSEYFCRMCTAQDHNYGFIPMKDENAHLKLEFEKIFNLTVSFF